MSVTGSAALVNKSGTRVHTNTTQIETDATEVDIGAAQVDCECITSQSKFNTNLKFDTSQYELIRPEQCH